MTTYLSNISLMIISGIFSLTVYPLLLYKFALDKDNRILVKNFIKSKIHINGK